ncbi:MAG: alpha/beta hydrolase [Chloroflexi bacterium]|nr:alpha/beta hydrolase [Chloroflexota bacterium]
MTEITHRTIQTNGINMHIAEAGEGPLVLLIHGFPELWYSWRHQLPALAEAGYHAVAPDVRGYGDTDKPPKIEDYAMREMVADYLGVLEHFGEDKAVIVGHDWGSMMAWTTAALHPERFRAVVGMSVPYLPRGPVPPVQMMKAMFKDKFFYILYFQEPGVAEAEFEADVRRSLRLFTWGASGEARSVSGFASAMVNKPADSKLFEGLPDVEGVPPWMTEEDLDYYVEKFTKGGFRGPINRYRCMDIDHEQLPEMQNRKIDLPALFVYGDADGALSFSPMDPMKQLVPNLKMVSFPGAGHWTQQERPKETNEALIDFLNGL